MEEDKIVKKKSAVQIKSVDKKEGTVKKVVSVKKEKVTRKVKGIKTEEIVNKIEDEDITEHDWKMKSNVHVRILSESESEFNADSKILYASKAEVEELEKENDTLVITVSFEGDIKDNNEEEVKIDNNEEIDKTL